MVKPALRIGSETSYLSNSPTDWVYSAAAVEKILKVEPIS